MSSAASALPLAVGVVMIALALKLELLVPLVKSRCAACGRLFRRGTVCPCARQSRD